MDEATKFGDTARLSAIVAKIVGADKNGYKRFRPER